jgi:ribosomal-protein-alanine N-acetyltransferase
LNAHPQVVEWLGSSPTRAQSEAMAARWSAELEQEGWGLWALEVVGGAPFVGVCGLHRTRPPIPCAPAVEVGWRLDPAHWGHGYATEAAAASLRHGFEVAGLPEIVSFTAVSNLRSQAVMQRIGLHRDPAADFDHPGQAEGSPLRRHVLYRAGPGMARPG